MSAEGTTATKDMLAFLQDDMKKIEASLLRSQELLHRCNAALQNALIRLDDLTVAVERVKP